MSDRDDNGLGQDDSDEVPVIHLRGNSRLHVDMVSVSVDAMGRGEAHVLFELKSTGGTEATLLTIVLDTEVKPEWSKMADAATAKLRDQLRRIAETL